MTFAVYNAGYLGYLQEGVPEPGDADDFLTMREYGPWRIQSKADMQDLVLLQLQVAMCFEAGWVEWNAGLWDRLLDCLEYCLPVLPALRAFTSRTSWGQLVLPLCCLCLLAGCYLGSRGMLQL